MLMKKFWIATTSLILVSGCGNENVDSKEENNVNVNVDGNEDEQLDDAETFGADESACVGETGCIKGFISHGQKLTMTWKNTTEAYDVDGNEISFDTTSFNDAEDFGDRFDAAFLKPLLGDRKAEDYSIKIAPTVRRDNFAVGVEIFTEAANAVDTVSMEGEGNFIISGIDGDLPNGQSVTMRLVKQFRIEIEKKEGAAEDTPEPNSAAICFTIDAQLDDLEISAGEITKVGGMRNFEFYYQEDPSLCSADKITDTAQERDLEAAELDPVQPEI